MHRALIKILVGLAVALGLTLAAAPAVQAAPVADGVAARAATPSCAAQTSATARAEHRYRKAKRSLRHARKALRKARARHASHKVVAHARHRVKVRVRKARKAKRHMKNARALRAIACRPTPTTPQDPGTTPSGTTDPIQSLCDAGVPQALCDGLAGAVGGGANPVTTTIDQLCAAAPAEAKPLCDALNGGTGTLDPAVLTDLVDQVLDALGLLGGPSADPIQSLCDAGVPQDVCDALAGLIPTDAVPAGTDPLDMPIDQVCSAVSQAQELCDLLDGQAPDPALLQGLLTTVVDELVANMDPSQLDPAVLQAALAGLLDQLGVSDQLDPSVLQGILEDVLGGLLGGGLPGGVPAGDLTGLGDLTDLVTGVLGQLGLGL